MDVLHIFINSTLNQKVLIFLTKYFDFSNIFYILAIPRSAG